MIGPVGYALVGLIFAGIVHLTTVLAMPWLAPRDGFARLNMQAADNRMALIDAAEVAQALPFSDPAVAVAACRYVLDKGPVRIRIGVGATPLTLLLMRRGVGIYQSISDKAATQGVLEVVIATQRQMDQIIDQDADDEPVQEIRVVSGEDFGLALVRGLVPLPSQRADVEALISGATCEPERLDEPE